MTIPAQQHRGPSGHTGSALPPRAGLPADIIELITADHRRIGRLRDALHDAARLGGDSGSGWILAHVWQRLSDLLEAHTQAEEEICYLPMFGPGPQAAERMREAVSDHDDLREAIREACLQPVGSALWWGAVRVALAASGEHIDREERELLACCGLTASRRRELGRQWLGFIAARRQDAEPGLTKAWAPASHAVRHSPGATGRRGGKIPEILSQNTGPGLKGKPGAVGRWTLFPSAPAPAALLMSAGLC